MKIIRAIISTTALIGSLVAFHPQVALASESKSVFQIPGYPVPVNMAPERSISIARYYRIRENDTLSGIAESHRIAWQSLYCENKQRIGGNPDIIKPGQRLMIPQKKVTCKIAVPKDGNTTTTTTADYVAGSQHTSVSTPPPVAQGSLQSEALSLLKGNTTEYNCLSNVISRESGWNVYASNPSTGAYGIPQALPGNKMSVAGPDWATNGYTQLVWMIDDYIAPVYGDACNAWNHELSDGWY